jgi:hypothetical protein
MPTRRQLIQAGLASVVASKTYTKDKKFTGFRCCFCGFKPKTSNQLFCLPTDVGKNSNSIKHWFCSSCLSKELTK